MRILHVLRKPLSEGTVAANTLKHGTGGINIDASRISSDGSHMVHGKVHRGDGTLMADRSGIGDGPGMFAPGASFTPTNHAGGRWPANVILQHLDGCRRCGVKKVKGIGGGSSKKAPNEVYGKWDRFHPSNHADEEGNETVVNWLCEPGCPVTQLDSRTEPTKSKRSMRGVGWSDSEVFGSGDPVFDTLRGFDDAGGVSRFYKQVGGSGENP